MADTLAIPWAGLADRWMVPFRPQVPLQWSAQVQVTAPQAGTGGGMLLCQQPTMADHQLLLVYGEPFNNSQSVSLDLGLG